MYRPVAFLAALLLTVGGCSGSSGPTEVADTSASTTAAPTTTAPATTTAAPTTTTAAPTTTVATTTTVASFDSVDWHAFYDWCLENRGYRGVDCGDWADDLQEEVNENLELEDCFLKAAKWSVVESTSDMNAPLVRNLWVPKRIACRELESSAATTAPPRAP